MRTTARLLVPCLLLLSLAAASPCRADDASRLAALVRDAGRHGDALRFLRGLSQLGDVNLDRAAIARGVAAVGVEPTGQIGELLRAATRLRVRGSQVELDLSREVLLEMEGGALGLRRQVRFRLRSGSGRTLLDRPSGIKVGKHRRALYDLRQVEFTTAAGRPVAHVTAGVAFFSQTVTVPLSPDGPVASNRRGATGALGAALD